MKLLTLEQACEIVQLSPWTLRRAIAKGGLAAYKVAGRIRIADFALEEWVGEGAIEPDRDAQAARPTQQVRPRAPSNRFRERARLAAAAKSAAL